MDGMTEDKISCLRFRSDSGEFVVPAKKAVARCATFLPTEVNGALVYAGVGNTNNNRCSVMWSGVW